MQIKRALANAFQTAVDLQFRALSAADVEHSAQFRLFTTFHRTDRLQQLQEMDRWLRVQRDQGRLLSFSEVAFSVHSGNGQDGILLYLLQLLGQRTGRIVDIGGSDGVAGNSGNLVINHGFDALIIDGNPRYVATGQRFYSRSHLLFNNHPAFALSMITKDNIEGTIAQHGFDGAIEVLSIDIDGNDFHILRAINNTRPKIIVLEFNNVFGPAESIVAPYNERAVQTFVDGFPYGGASLTAFTRMLAQKGFRLVGVDTSGQDAYFVDQAVGTLALPAVSPEACFEDSRPWRRAVKAATDSAVRRQPWEPFQA